MTFIFILFFVGITMGIGLLVFGNKYQIKSVATQYNSFNPTEKTTHIKDIFKINKIYEGVIFKPDQCYLLTKIEGINLTVMSEIEQDSREATLISILTRLDYPIRFITNTIVVDTSKEAMKAAELAANTPEGNLKTYRTLYAGALEQMRVERSVLTQQTYLVIPGNYPEEAYTRLELLNTALRDQTSMIITPIKTSDEIYDAIQNILMPEKIIKPSDIVAAGVLEPVHFHQKEVLQFVQEN